MDIYNQIHPEETPELISKSQAALYDELEKIPLNKKAGWLQAKEKCPHLTSEDHTLLFLRCEVFNADLAAIRLVKYWDKRIEIFGPIHAFEPLALTSSLGPDIERGLSIQFMRLTRTSDTGSRALMYAEAMRLMNAYDKSKDEDRLNIARAVWYLFHSALEEEHVQKRGMVFLINYLGAQISMVDRKLMKLVMPSVSGCLPIRVGAIHVCNPRKLYVDLFGILFEYLILPTHKSCSQSPSCISKLDSLKR